MTLYVLTSINEDFEIVEQSIHTNFLEASDKMREQFERERDAMLNDGVDIIGATCYTTMASLAYGTEPCAYEWRVKKIEC